MINYKDLKICHRNSSGRVNVQELMLGKGEILHIAGLSGSGKSTLMEYMAGLIPSACEALVDCSCSENLAQRKFMVLQNVDSPFFYSTVEEELAHTLHFLSGSSSAETVKNWCEKFDLCNLLQRRVSDLSAGEKQKLYLTMALMHEPELLILDEPTAYLDLSGAQKALSLIEEQAEKGKAVVVSNHRNREMGIRTRLAGLENGVLIHDSEKSGIKPDVLSRFGIYPDMDCARKRRSTLTGVELICITELGFSFDGKNNLFSNINAQIRKGEWIHISGLNGSGKTTLLKLIMGRLFPSSGTIAAKNIRFGYLPQNYRYYARHDTLKQEMNWIQSKGRSCEKADYFIEKLGVKHLLNRDLLYLSRGEAQRVFILLALVSSPDVLILDEPGSGQDSESLVRIMETLSEAAAGGAAVVIVSHEEWLAHQWADTHWNIKQGGMYCSNTISRN